MTEPSTRRVRMFPSILGAASTIATVAILSSTVNAAEIIKADNTTVLNASGSWVGSVVPTATDVAVWNNTITTNRSTAIGGNLVFQGLKFTNPGGNATLMTIGTTANATLSLGSAGIDMSTSTVNVSIGANLTYIANQTISVASGRTLSLTGTGTSGSGNLNLTGPGTILSTTNTFGTGNLTLGGGIRLGSTSASSRTLTNNMTVTSDISLIKPSAGGIVFGNASFVDFGSEVRTISIVDTGGAQDAVQINGNITLFNSQFTGSGGVKFVNSAESTVARTTLRIGNSANTTYAINTGITIGQNVTSYVATASAFTSLTRLTVENGGSLRLSNSLTSAVGSAISVVVQSISGAGGNISYGGNNTNSTITINGGNLTTRTEFAGDFLDDPAVGNRTLSISKNGSTTQVLSGNNLYSGTTQVNGGTLLINGTNNSSGSVITGANGGWGSAADGNYRVASGATLGGSGRIAGTNNQTNSNLVLVQSGGFLAPGDGIGTLTLNGAGVTGGNSTILRMAAGSQFNFQLSANGGTPDRIDFWNFGTGDFVLNNNILNLDLAGTFAPGTYTVDLFRFFSNNGTTATASGLTSGLTLVGANINSDIMDASIIYGTNVIQLQYTVVPEPGTWAIIALVGGLIVWRVRRRLT